MHININNIYIYVFKYYIHIHILHVDIYKDTWYWIRRSYHNNDDAGGL